MAKPCYFEQHGTWGDSLLIDRSGGEEGYPLHTKKRHPPNQCDAWGVMCRPSGEFRTNKAFHK